MFFSFLSCQKKEIKVPNIINEGSIIGHTFYRVEKFENKYILLEPCDAHIPKYIAYKDSIYHDWGQEHYSLNIITQKKLDDKIIFETTYKYNGEKPDDSDSTLIFQSLDKEKKIWKINDEIFIDSQFINTIQRKKQPCKECGNCEGEKIADILISSLFDSNQLTKQWSNHCEKGVGKDNIMFYSPEEIGFNISSINFICGATSKQIDDKTIGIYLKDSGTDYAPNGEVYSNNNLPKGINFDDISQDKPVAQVKILNKDSVELSWLGFYNKKTNKREYLSNPFDKNKNTVVLSSCTE